MVRNCSPPDSPKGPAGVICARAMPEEPRTKRAVSFVDGQNLYRHAKDAFGHHHPNYDPVRLAAAVCVANGWVAAGVRFYTGVPDAARSPMWQGYWTRRLTAMRRAGVAVTVRRPRRHARSTARLRQSWASTAMLSASRRAVARSRSACAASTAAGPVNSSVRLT